MGAVGQAASLSGACRWLRRDLPALTRRSRSGTPLLIDWCQPSVLQSAKNSSPLLIAWKRQCAARPRELPFQRSGRPRLREFSCPSIRLNGARGRSIGPLASPMVPAEDGGSIASARPIIQSCLRPKRDQSERIARKS
jgi:hypothetical protein